MSGFLDRLRSMKQRVLKYDPVYAREPWRNPKQHERIIREFHGLYYDSFRDGKTWFDTWFLGVKVEKCPLDLWLYQEILFELRPDLIIETGTRFGGSAFFLASMCDLIGSGEVITVDIDDSIARPDHSRITYLTGSSTDPKIVEGIRERARDKKCVMVLLDSDHSQDHVLAELNAYSDLVTTNSFMIVEDTNLNGNPVLLNFGPGPKEAMDEFLSENGSFAMEQVEAKFLLSFNPNGFLRRIR